jgi:RES domain-containing protein
MATVWRLTAPHYAARLDGKGNVERGARWNSPGRGVVYASFNLSLAVLETLVQLPAVLRRNLPEMAAARIEFPDAALGAEVVRNELPADLATATTIRRCRELGDSWLATGERLVLAVPSVIVPQERNLLINPAHRHMDQVRIASIEPFRFDPRLAATRR